MTDPIAAWRSVQLRVTRSGVAATVTESFASGYIVRPGVVLTAGHAVRGATAVEIRVWLNDGDERVVVQATQWSDLLEVDFGWARFEADQPRWDQMPPVSFARINDNQLDELAAMAMGYPRFKFRTQPSRDGDSPAAKVRAREIVHGSIQPGDNPGSGTTEFHLDHTGPEPGANHSPWEAMSGGIVVCRGRIVGVVTDHYPESSTGTLTVLRLDAIYGLSSTTTLNDFAAVVGVPSNISELQSTSSLDSQGRDIDADTTVPVLPRLVDSARVVALISQPRMRPFMAIALGNQRDATVLYERHARLAAALFEGLGWVEVVLRNAIDAQLRVWNASQQSSDTSPFSASWCLSPAPPLRDLVQRDLTEARRRASRSLQHDPSHDDVIANLSFKTWRYLLPSNNKAKVWLWSVAVSGAFPHLDTTYSSRPDAESTLPASSLVEDVSRLYRIGNRIRWLEPLLNTATPENHRCSFDVLTARTTMSRVLSSVSPEAAAWFDNNHRPAIRSATLRLNAPLS